MLTFKSHFSFFVYNYGLFFGIAGHFLSKITWDSLLSLSLVVCRCLSIAPIESKLSWHSTHINFLCCSLQCSNIADIVKNFFLHNWCCVFRWMHVTLDNGPHTISARLFRLCSFSLTTMACERSILWISGVVSYTSIKSWLKHEPVLTITF